MTDRDANIAARAPENLPNANELLAAVAALAHHLDAAGVSFLPQANPAAVEQLQASFAAIESVPTGDADEALTAPPATKNTAASANSEDEPTTPRAATSSPAIAARSDLLSPSSAYELPVLSSEDRVAQLDQLRHVVSGCVRCPQLAQGRIHTVFGEGNPNARVAFFGEGPGADEDRSGRPFVGRAGELLTKMIQACTFAREDVYIFNTVKCRPPGNRNPEPTEIANCREYFEQQLDIIQPEYIVCLGAVAAQTLLQTTEPVGRLRGRWHQYFASKVLVTYHPAYLLRNPAAKKAAWEDLKRMLADMGIQPA